VVFWVGGDAVRTRFELIPYAAVGFAKAVQLPDFLLRKLSRCSSLSPNCAAAAASADRSSGERSQRLLLGELSDQ
jgi:hypothetical protein